MTIVPSAWRGSEATMFGHQTTAISNVIGIDIAAIVNPVGNGTLTQSPANRAKVGTM
jgi:hypothetical protein